jgi:hypothetical protein
MSSGVNPNRGHAHELLWGPADEHMHKPGKAKSEQSPYRYTDQRVEVALALKLIAEDGCPRAKK